MEKRYRNKIITRSSRWRTKKKVGGWGKGAGGGGREGEGGGGGEGEDNATYT